MSDPVTSTEYGSAIHLSIAFVFSVYVIQTPDLLSNVCFCDIVIKYAYGVIL